MEVYEFYFLKVLLLENSKGPTISTIHRDVNNCPGFGEDFMNYSRQCYIFRMYPKFQIFVSDTDKIYFHFKKPE